MNSQLRKQLNALPDEPGIYKYFDSTGELLYVGKAVNLKNRVKSYFVDTKLSPKTRILVKQIDTLEYITVRSEMDALILEANLIKEHKPRYNIILKDDKSHLYIKITLYEDFPRISTCRQTDISLDTQAEYYGPYPSSTTVKKTLRSLRRIFPYLAHNQPPVTGRRRPPQSYFYYNLTLESSGAPVNKKEYRKQIFQLVRFLEGKRQVVVEGMEKEMRQAAKRLDFEHAAAIKQQVEGMNYITQASISPESYMTNPELIVERREQGVQELQTALIPHFPEIDMLSSKKLSRIECYDISNISGKFAVGSMVVFINGEADRSNYRRFRIKRENVPNDVAMLEEVLRRRFKRITAPDDEADKSDASFLSRPDLLLVDGGKGQIAVAIKVLNDFGLNIPLAGMTKREEELVFAPHITPTSTTDLNDNTLSLGKKPKRSSAHGAVIRTDEDARTQTRVEQNFTTIRLPRGSEALFLIQRVRDEAHRFAITYHRKVRSQSFLPQK